MLQCSFDFQTKLIANNMSSTKVTSPAEVARSATLLIFGHLDQPPVIKEAEISIQSSLSGASTFYFWNKNYDPTCSYSRLADEISDSHQIVLLINCRPPALSELLCHLAMVRCVNESKRIIHVVKNFRDNGEPLLQHRRIRQMVHYYDLCSNSGALDELLINLKSQNEQEHSESSGAIQNLGEGLAWQLSVGFLSCILPRLESVIQASLADFQPPPPLVRDEVLVLPKYFMLLKPELVTESIVGPCTPQPPELVGGCQIIPDVTIKFPSHGYEKYVQPYLMKLDIKNSKISHIVLFGGYAAPTFAIRRLEDVSDAQKKEIFADFQEALYFICSHPDFEKLMNKLDSDTRAIDLSHSPTASSNLVLVNDPDQMLQDIVAREARNFVARQSQDLEVPVAETPAEAQVPRRLLLAFSPSVPADSVTLLRATLVRQTGIEATANVSEDFARAVLVLHLTDLLQSCEANSPALMITIEQLVIKMHTDGEYNIAVIVMFGNEHREYLQQRDIFDCLPSLLRHLPDSCVVKLAFETSAVEDVDEALGQMSVQADEFQSRDPGSDPKVRFAFPNELESEGRRLSDVVSALQLNSHVKAGDIQPLLSVAPSMVANIIGFIEPLIAHAQATRGAGMESVYNGRYYFVLPKSCRYPDEGNLHAILERPPLNIRIDRRRFTDTATNRQYNIRVYQRADREAAFEFPPSLWSLHRLVHSAISGLSHRRIMANVECFKERLKKLERHHRSCYFELVEWDDTGFFDDAEELGESSEPAAQVQAAAERLLQCLNLS